MYRIEIESSIIVQLLNPLPACICRKLLASLERNIGTLNHGVVNTCILSYLFRIVLDGSVFNSVLDLPFKVLFLL